MKHRSFAAGLIVGAFGSAIVAAAAAVSLAAPPALTTEQKFEHVGRALFHGFATGALALDDLKEMIAVGKDYRINGNYGTQGERSAAMRAALRAVWKVQTGKDPDMDLQARHELQKHYVEAVVEGDGGNW